MVSYNFALANSSYANQVLQKAGASGLSLFVFDNRKTQQSPISFLYHKHISETALNAYANGLYQHDPLIPHATSIHRNCKTFTGVNLHKSQQNTQHRNLLNKKDQRYWKYFSTIGFEEAAATFKAISNNMFLVVGLHLCEHNKHISIDAAAPYMDIWLKEAGEYVIDTAVTEFCANKAANEGIAPIVENIADLLTSRQYQVVCELLKGKTNKQIANTLSISNYTVENYLRHIYKKFNVHNRTALVARVNGEKDFS